MQEGHKHSTYLATDVGQPQVQCHTLSALFFLVGGLQFLQTERFSVKKTSCLISCICLSNFNMFRSSRQMYYQYSTMLPNLPLDRITYIIMRSIIISNEVQPSQNGENNETSSVLFKLYVTFLRGNMTYCYLIKAVKRCYCVKKNLLS